MSKLLTSLTILALVICCFSMASAQSKPEVMIKIEQAMKDLESEWHCISVATPQGEPGPESPRGTQYLFRCQQKTMRLSIFILYGESKHDAEKALTLSQRLQINESRPVDGIGEQAYQLARERLAWITFRKANVFTQIVIGVQLSSQYDASPEMETVTGNELIESVRLFANLVADHIPAE
jgi:hypothetical protein